MSDGGLRKHRIITMSFSCDGAAGLQACSLTLFVTSFWTHQQTLSQHQSRTGLQSTPSTKLTFSWSVTKQCRQKRQEHCGIIFSASSPRLKTSRYWQHPRCWLWTAPAKRNVEANRLPVGPLIALCSLGFGGITTHCIAPEPSQRNAGALVPSASAKYVHLRELR